MKPITFTTTQTSLAIREYLQSVGDGYPAEFVRMFKKVRPKTSYPNVYKYFYYLRKLGLIERSKQRRGRSPMIAIQYHRVVPEKIKDPAWSNPQKFLYDKSD